MVNPTTTPPPSDPRLAYDPTQRPQVQTNYTFLVVVALAVWILFFNGWNTVKGWISIDSPGAPPIVYQTATAAPWIAPPPAPAPQSWPQAGSGGAPAYPTAQVPAGSGTINDDTILPTVAILTWTPQPPTVTAVPTAYPTAAPEVEAIYALVIATLTPVPMDTCEVGSEPYVTAPNRVYTESGLPLGEVQGRSCVSMEEAEANVRAEAAKVLATYNAQQK